MRRLCEARNFTSRRGRCSNPRLEKGAFCWTHQKALEDGMASAQEFLSGTRIRYESESKKHGRKR